MGCHGIGGDDRRGLGQAIPLEHGNADGVEEALQLDVEQGTAAHEEFQPAAEVLPDLAEQELVIDQIEGLFQGLQAPAPVPSFAVVGGGQLHGPLEEPLHLGPLAPDGLLDALAEVLGQGRHAEQDVGPGLLDVDGDVLQRLQGRGPQLDRGQGRPSAHHGVDAAGVAKGVVPGKDDGQDEVLPAGHEGQGLLDVGGVVAVGQYDALGVGRRPRGVADVGGIALLDGLPAGLEFRLAGPEEFPSFVTDILGVKLVRLEGAQPVEDDRPLKVGQVLLDLANLVDMVLGDDDHPAAGMGQTELEVGQLLHPDRDGHVDRSGEQDAELAHDPVVPAFGDEGHPVARAEAEGHESRAEGADPVPRLTVGLPPVGVPSFLPEQDVLGVGPDAVLEQPWKSSLVHGLLPPRVLPSGR